MQAASHAWPLCSGHGGLYLSKQRKLLIVIYLRALDSNLTLQTIVKVELADPAAAVLPPATQPANPAGVLSAVATSTPEDAGLGGVNAAVLTPSGGRWSMSHIEQILGAFSGNYTASFIPKLINLTGNCANGPWKLYGLNLQGAMKDLAQEVWPNITLNIVPRQPFFEVVRFPLWAVPNIYACLLMMLV